MKKILSVIFCFVILLSVPLSVEAAAPDKVKSVQLYLINADNLKIKFKCVKNASSYDVLCSKTRKGGYKNIKTVENSDGSKKLKVKIKNLEPETKYYFKIRSKRGSAKGKASDPVMVITKSLNPEENTAYDIIRQNDPVNKKIKYAYENNGKTVGTSGCGPCSALMVLRNTTNYCTELKDFAKQCVDTESRIAGGSDMLRIAELLNMYYSMDYVATDSNELLKAHLEKGYMATAHVGARHYFSSSGGHFVTVAGIIKGETPEEDRAIILDPFFTLKKYNSKKRIKLGIEYTPDGLVIAPFDTLFADGKDEYYVLYTPQASVQKSEEAPFIPTPVIQN